MIRALMIEDEIQSQNTLRLIVQDNCPQVDIIGIAASVSEAVELNDTLHPDLLFLDVQLIGGTAFDFLMQIKYTSPHIIFTSAYDSYALQAIKYAALDYLLKPLDIQEVKKAVDKVQKTTVSNDHQFISKFIDSLKNTNRNSGFLPVANNEGFNFIPFQQILRLEASGSYTYIHVQGRSKILASKNLKEYESMLPEDSFIRVHNSHLLNKLHITKYVKGSGGYCVMSDGESVSISTRRKDWFLRMMGISE
ncbi:MAG: response regulator transcription factor [Bacteroidetes bacterium]|nr:response regulator transcription factor [Bacteroidota bacterium]